MSSVDVLIDSIESVLTGITGTGYTSASDIDDVYEGYVLSRFIHAAAALGWSWTLETPAGPAGPLLRFRCGPGVIHSPTEFTFARLTHPDQEDLEAHLGIMVAGRSEVAHEYDLAVITRAAADTARLTHQPPPWDSVAVHAECKFYSGALSLGLGRALRGLSADCRLRLRGGLVSNGPEVESIRDLLKHHGAYYRPNGLPGSSGETDLDADLRKRLSRWMAG